MFTSKKNEKEKKKKKASASIYLDPFNMSVWSVGGWASGWADGGLGGFGAGSFCNMLEMAYYRCTVVGIRLTYFCAILFNVLYVIVSVGWRNHSIRVTAIFFASGS